LADEGAEWIVVRTKPCQEMWAAKNVRRQQHDYYLPQFFCKRLKRRRPLFPSYLFVRVFNRRYDFLRNTFGIAKVMACGDAPATVAPAVIEALSARENQNGVIQLPEEVHDDVLAKLKPGDSVRVTEGPFIGFKALYQGMTAHNRVKILLSLSSGGRIQTSIERGILQPV